MAIRQINFWSCDICHETWIQDVGQVIEGDDPVVSWPDKDQEWTFIGVDELHACPKCSLKNKAEDV